MCEISWYVELLLRPGALDSFRKLTERMIACTKLEPGMLVYERFISDDDTTVHVYERYASSAAAMAHLNEFQANYASEFARMVERVSFVVFGSPSEELRALLASFGASFARPLID